MYFVKKARRSVPSQWCHSGDATSKRERERKGERDERESEKERAARGDTCGQKRDKERMSQRTVTVVSQR